MTLLLSWIGKDSRKISSFYIASDSRFTWSNPIKYDYGSKVFALPNSPDILGYCGDVIYPTIILNQIIQMDRDKILFDQKDSNLKRSETIFNILQAKFDQYPAKQIMDKSLEIIHVSRDNEIDFICNIFSWTRSQGWKCTPKEIPNSSDKVIILGTGKDEFYERYLEYYKGNNGKTSRSLFQCLTKSLLDMKDLKCGGSPQLVGLYNRFNGNNFGIIYKNKRYYLGKELDNNLNLNNIEWRNELFERCDGNSTRILSNAQRQPDDLRN